MIDYLASFANTNGVAFPDTESINVTAPGAGDGTEFVKLMVDDIWGRAQALMDYAGLVPDGVSEAPDTAQILDAIGLGFGVGPGVGVIYWKNDTPAVHGDRILLLQGQEILIATYPLLFAAVYVGDPDNPTAPAFYATNGAGVRTLPGGGATHFILPDSRGLSLKNIGDAIVNGRTKTGPVELGEEQEDQAQHHWHDVQSKTGGQKFYEDTGGAGGRVTIVTATADLARPFEAEMMITDGVSGAPRGGANTRDSILGTNFGITY